MVYLLLLAAGLGGCSSGSSNGTGGEPSPGDGTGETPAVSAISPAVFAPGSLVFVSGSSLDGTTLAVNGEGVELLSQSAHVLEFIAPELPPGEYQFELRSAEADFSTQVRYLEALRVDSVSLGTDHACAVTREGSAVCWGDARYGKLGNGARSGQFPPVAVAGLRNVVAVSSAGQHSCALDGEGTIHCWGLNRHGQLGSGPGFPPAAPVAVDGLPEARSISAGGNHTCATFTDGRARCWGSNGNGQLGDGGSAGSAIPVVVQGLADVAGISAGYLHSCAVTGAGEAFCWGANQSGQLGNGTLEPALTPVAVQGLPGRVLAIGVGEQWSCALTDSDQVWCWGDDVLTGAVGESFASSTLPVQVAQFGNVHQLSVGNRHACVLSGEGLVDCWGANFHGTLGRTYDRTPYSLAPLRVERLTAAGAINAGDLATCAVGESKELRCWGSDIDGLLGTGPAAGRVGPFIVGGIEGATGIESGEGYRCALVDGSDTLCWGDNGYGQLGNGSRTATGVPTPVSGLADVAALSLGGGQSCALLGDASVSCWGLANLSANLLPAWESGVDENDYILVPRAVPGLDGTAALSIGSYSLYAIGDAGEVLVQGVREAYADGSIDYTATPAAFPALSGVESISSGGIYSSAFQSCALLSDGSVQCWSIFDGASGSGANAPVTIAGLSNIDAIDTSSTHACALGEGRLQCWGDNTAGQLGDGSLNASEQPVAVKGLDDVIGVVTGSAFTCALVERGSVYCWGSAYGPLLEGESSDATEPVAMPGLVDVVQISGSSGEVCARYADGVITCWGDPGSIGPGYFPAGEQREVVSLP
ncbi:RCC1 domain-containing protein [Haliea sp. E17]|uniref:RCC1 domain-containing protein n=1 Tax=Haliea sp. E17 TaxID=3401576 RepID=UPI003AAF7D11